MGGENTTCRAAGEKLRPTDWVEDEPAPDSEDGEETLQKGSWVEHEHRERWADADDEKGMLEKAQWVEEESSEAPGSVEGMLKPQWVEKEPVGIPESSEDEEGTLKKTQ